MLSENIIQNKKIYILIFFTYSFAGWFMESVGGILNVKKFINRGFLIGPYCPVYGIGVVIVSILLKNYSNDIPALFILSTVICGTLEYLTSYLMEKLFNARWWDYHNKKFNINGRICLEMLIPFGIASTLIICYLNPLLLKFFQNLNPILIHIITAFLTICIIIDFIISFVIISSFKGETYATRDNTEEIENKVKEKTEEIGNKVKNKTEDVLMKAESDFRLFGRRLKLSRLKLEKKVRFTRKKISETTILTIKNIANEVDKKRKSFIEKVSREKNKVDEQMKQRRAEYELKQKEKKQILSNEFQKRKNNLIGFQKISKEKFSNTVKSIKNSSEEFTKIVTENFRKKSILRNRLIEAFPKLEVKISKEKGKKNKNKEAK